MELAWQSARMRWAIASGGAVGVVGLLVLLFRQPTPPPPLTLPQRAADVSLARPTATDRLLSEQTVLRDNAPLFLPTKWNATLAEPKPREPARAFLEAETVKLMFADSNLGLTKNLPQVVALNGKPPAEAKPLDAILADAAGGPLAGFGRSTVKVAPLPARGGLIEVFATATGERVLADSLMANVRPPTDKAWQPVEFLAAVDSIGLVGPLVRQAGSGVEEADAFFRDYLARTHRLGDRLHPGFYRVVVSP